jgi:hypothetical protein
MLKALAAILPNFDRYSLDNFVANGFNIPAGLMTQCLLTALAFLVPIFVASYLCFKMREVAK